MKFRPSFAASLCIAVFASALVTSPVAHADENFFGYIYGADTLPQGRTEIYQWVTLRTGKSDGHYRALDLQTEFERGLTDRLQTSLYLNAVQHDIAGVSGMSDRDGLRFNGLQGSIKYNLRSAYKDGYGLAVYVEPGYTRYARVSGDREDSFFFETKLIHEKNYLDGALVWATNLEAEFERAHNLDEAEWESELELQLSTGVSCRVAPGWFAGIEGVASAAFERMHLDEPGEYAIFAGPSLHYAAQRWWFTVTWLSQLSGWPEDSGARNLANFEKTEVRLKAGLNF